MWGWIVALISGALMSIQGVFNTGLTKQTSLWVANSWVQGTALLVCLGAWFLKERQSFGALFQVDHKYLLLGRCDRSFYYTDGHCEYGTARPCKGGADYCCFPVGGGLSD